MEAKESKCFAGIDIGSNAIRLLLKRGYPNRPELPLEKVQLIRVPIRLGEDVFTDGKISKTKRTHLLSLMKAYREIMSIYDVSAYRACATSAMREASNGKKVSREIEKLSGIKIGNYQRRGGSTLSQRYTASVSYSQKQVCPLCGCGRR